MKSQVSDACPHRCRPRHNPGFGKIRSEAASRHATAGAAKIRIVNKKYEKCGFSKARGTTRRFQRALSEASLVRTSRTSATLGGSRGSTAPLLRCIGSSAEKRWFSTDSGHLAPIRGRHGRRHVVRRYDQL